jgi:hypothetical protein
MYHCAATSPAWAALRHHFTAVAKFCGGQVLRNAPPAGGVDDAAPCLRTRDTLRCGHLREPQCLCPSRRNHVIVSRGAMQKIQPHGTVEMEVSKLVLAACVYPVRGVHGVIPPRKEGVFESERHLDGASVPLEAESKTPAPAKVVTIREESGGDQAKVLEREGPSRVHPTLKIFSRELSFTLLREGERLTCCHRREKNSLGRCAAVSHEIPEWALRVRRGRGAARECL